MPKNWYYTIIVLLYITLNSIFNLSSEKIWSLKKFVLVKILISMVASRQYGAVSSKIWSTEKIKTKKNWKFRKKPSHCSILPSHCSILPAHCSILPAHCSKLPAGYGVNSWYIKYINWCPREKPQYSENSIKPQRKICHLSQRARSFSLLEFSSYFGFLPLTPVDIQ